MPVYPYKLSITKNVRSALVPIISANVYVFISGSNEKAIIYQDSLGTPGTEIQQPLITDSNGEISFYVAAGRIRIDAQIDGVSVQTLEDYVADQDIITLPIVGETPEGLIDSINTVFSLSQTPNPNRVILYVNGTRWRRVGAAPTGAQYMVLANEVTMGQAPTPGDIILIDFWVV